MKKKGFTLIELLAVIIILAIISLIVTPMISNLIQNARKAAAKNSAQGYVDVVKNKISLSALDNQNIHGIHAVSELDSVLEYSGTRVERGIVIVDGDILEEAKLCVNGYSFKYYSDKLEESNIDYCVDKSNLEITVLGTSIEEELNNQYSYDLDLTSYDISSATNVVCNNNAIPSIDNNTLHITDVFGDTKCSIESSIVTTFDNLDDTVNTIVMIADETLNKSLVVGATKDVIFNLNGKTLETVDPDDLNEETVTWSFKYVVFDTYGNLIINDPGNNGHINSNIKSSVLYSRGAANITINGGNFNGRNLIQNYSESEGNHLTINDGNFSSKKYSIVYNVKETGITTINGGNFITDYDHAICHDGGKIEINGGTFISRAKYAIKNQGIANITGGTFISDIDTSIRNEGSGSMNISNAKIYAVNSGSTTVQWKHGIAQASSGPVNIGDNVYVENKADNDNTNRGIYTSSTGVVNINGSIAQFDDNGNYISGIYVKNVASYAICNATSTITINGGTYVSDNFSAMGNTGGTLNVSNARLYAINSGSSNYTWRHGIANYNTAVVNIGDNVYIENKGTSGYTNTGIMNDGVGTININGNKAVFDSNNNYVSGVYIVTAKGQGIRNKGTININGGTIRSYDNTFTNVAADAIANLKNGDFSSLNSAVLKDEATDAVLNVCTSTINGPTYDFAALSGTINYSSDVVFRDGTNNPNNHITSGTINAVSTCPITE